MKKRIEQNSTTKGCEISNSFVEEKMRTITGSRDICVIFYHCELLSDKGSWFFKQLIFRFSCSTIFLSKYIFFCVCCCVVPAQIVVMCHARIWVLLYYSRKLHFSVAYSSSRVVVDHCHKTHLVTCYFVCMPPFLTCQKRNF